MANPAETSVEKLVRVMSDEIKRQGNIGLAASDPVNPGGPWVGDAGDGSISVDGDIDLRALADAVLGALA